ncbi:MAG TPA: presqualene diphosphate synthase HpnD [Alphaproteobacteria bacterium]|nr:presqualene diphosphate synthase HpnD [Alphaproteobacteria bacterium]
MASKPAVSTTLAAETSSGAHEIVHVDRGTQPANPIALADARAEVQRIVANSRTSFQAGMRILPAPRREAMYAIYAFCREVDDIADEPAPDAEKRRGLAAWRAAIEALYAGQPDRPITVALARPVAEYGLDRADFLAVVEGMEMDAYEAICGPAMAELDCYCDRVASAVGRLSVRAFGSTEPQSADVARHLGRALQLTNILRDLNEDAERGRLYLPSEFLDAASIETRDPMAVLAHANLGAACDSLAEVAREHYRQAAAALAQCARRPMRPANVMMHAYQRVLDALKRRGWSRHAEPVSISKLSKLWIVLRYGLI